MNIPLNIDWQQILLHLFNFSILLAGLSLLLYKPVKDFMDKRTAYYKQLDDETKEKLEKAKNLEELYQKQIEQADDEISQLKAKAALEAEQSADEQLKSAKKQAEKMLADAQDGARKEREKILVQTQQDIAKLAAVATQKLVMESMDDVYDQFLRAAEGGGVNESHRQ